MSDGRFTGSAPALDPSIATRLKRNDAGLVCAVTVDKATNDVLMVAWMNDESLAITLETRQATYFSRSRNKLWRKGEESGHTQYVHEVRLDCDGDTLLVIVDQVGPACHTGTRTCFDSDQILAPE
ncbi:phosphoribosyl-AMP cyclohydrolase [Smaragdicoccus niigatensis]|uniref:phosphoribosyl-AMP cyclohydrolase n=1 Tax=Smaragdicoccus niigatensis TaxID=359359 RepID=UPI0003686C1F|nr:phosphoribosyl-AMP cyclohydrolase [Smaragdicoccus niigatensis]